MVADRQRIDKWLWHARIVRTRTAAAALAQSGAVRVNGVRADAASRPVKRGDVLTVALDAGVRVLAVRGFAERRSSADAARVLYDEDEGNGPLRGESNPHGVAPDESHPGAAGGRPDKRQRRAIKRVMRGDEP